MSKHGILRRGRWDMADTAVGDQELTENRKQITAPPEIRQEYEELLLGAVDVLPEG